MTILDTIVSHKRHEVANAKKRGLIGPERDVPGHRGFRDALVQDHGLSIIAEVKKASPSKGLLCPDFNPKALALDYRSGGAAAVSVLTDQRFFQGDIRYLALVKEEADLPVLRKDFIIDHFQIEEARVWGADAVLLIVAILEDSQLNEFMAHGRELSLDCLVEVHDQAEAERALKAGADLIGVNNRNLADFTVDLNTTFTIRQQVPLDVPMVSESGISTRDDIESLARAGVQAALIGESLVRAKDRINKLKGFLL